MDAGPRAPAEPEQVDWDEEAAGHGGWEAFLWLWLAVLVEPLLLDKVQVGEDGRDSDEGAGHDAEEGEAFLA